MNVNKPNKNPPGPPAPLPVVPTIYPTSPPVADVIDSFWDVGPGFDSIEVHAAPSDQPLALLERLGPSPFERGEFPLVGFFATTYEKVTRYALERG